MFRFTIRDLMWVMMVAGFGLCWYLERDGRHGLRERAMVLHQENEKLRVQLQTVRIDSLRSRIETRQFLREMVNKVNAGQSSQTE